MKRLILTICFTLAFTAMVFGQATQGPTSPGAVPIAPPAERADAATLIQHSHSSAGTITLSAGPAGTATGSIYVTGLDISNCQGSAVTAAAPTYITTTGLNGSPQYQVGSGPATAGTCTPTSVISFSAPLKSATSGTNVTFVLPSFIANQTVSVNVYYRLGY